MWRFVRNMTVMGGLCALALALWYVFPPLSVLVVVLIAGIASGDSDLLR